jgi:hypothetical protein
MADAHFEIYDAAGNLQIDLGSRVFRVLTVADTGTSNGSKQITAPISGSLAILHNAVGGGAYLPNASVSGSTLSWTFPGSPDETNLSVLAY